MIQIEERAALDILEFNMLILIIGLILLITCVSILCVIFINNIQQREKTRISFKEGLDLTELPIVTFICNNKKLHFLLDTGSNISYINKGVLKEIPHKDIGKVSSVMGIENSGIVAHHYSIDIGYKDNKFTEVFGAVDLSATFDAMEKENGIRVHGILGSKFFEKYKYILDFKELAAYR